MKKFVVLYTAPMSAEQQIAANSPEAAEAGLKAWTDWAAKTGDALVDFGSPLGGGKELSTSGVADTITSFGGYSILQAEDMDAALELVKGHPHFMTADSATIQVYETLEIPGASGM